MERTSIWENSSLAQHRGRARSARWRKCYALQLNSPGDSYNVMVMTSPPARARYVSAARSRKARSSHERCLFRFVVRRRRRAAWQCRRSAGLAGHSDATTAGPPAGDIVNARRFINAMRLPMPPLTSKSVVAVLGLWAAQHGALQFLLQLPQPAWN